MREACSKIKPDLIAKLNHPGETVVDTFRKIFYIIYDQDEKTFVWDEFKKKALLLDNGNDFLSRLANINIKNVPEKKKAYIKVLRFEVSIEIANKK